jgi:SNF2 family DNA or RNA helicase
VTMLANMAARMPCDHVLYHGSLPASNKAENIARFTRDKNCRVLLSSHAGAYGTDLYMANYLINFDLHWSAGKADQINGRHVRASSKFDSVVVRDIVTRGTIEERKHEMLDLKRTIGTAIVDGHGADSDGSIINDLKSLTSHLETVTLS